MFRSFTHSSIFSGRHYLNEWLSYNQCVLCFGTVQGRSLCSACVADLPWWGKSPQPTIPHVDSTVVSFRYDYPINRLIQAGKYGGNYGLITALATLMPEIDSPNEHMVVYPVPVSHWRLLRRGFNQSSVISREVTRGTSIATEEVSIHKRVFQPDQSALDGEQRKLNARGLFYAQKFQAAKHAVIIDDVVTTGATVSTIAKILRYNGAKQVDVYALAAVP